MSFRVMVVPEDPTHNGYILKPLVARMMAECAKPQAIVLVLSNPKAAGYDHAKALLEDQVLERYAHFDLILFLPDADGKDRQAEFDRLEGLACGKHARLICCAAVQEVEAWLLAGHLDKVDRTWPQIRDDVSVEDTVFQPFLDKHGDLRRAGGGRDLLMAETLRNYRGLVDRCSELADLERRIKAFVAAEE